MTKTATVSLHGNTYQVDPTLVGRKVELVFAPFDLTHIQVRHAGTPMGLAIPHRTGRHAHPKARPETPPPAPPKPTGIDYARLIDTAHQAELAHKVTTPPWQQRPTVAGPARPIQRPGRNPMIDRLQGFFGFTRMPFGCDLAPGMLHRHADHSEAVARIGWCLTERRIGVITGEVAALDQRIALRYNLPPMTDQEIGSYLRHHLSLAGRSDTLFSDDAITLIHQTSRGYPRAVNNLALQALVATFAGNKAIVAEKPPAPPSPKSRQTDTTPTP